jgi:Acyl-CoA thioesterase N-terminal domain/Acyl-CoA thioesterase C-terminal domain
MAAGVFQKQGNLYTPTEIASGPWSPKFLHGGATGGLIAHALENFEPRQNMRFARINLDMFRPVPMKPLTVKTEIIREGSRIQVIQALVFSEGKEVVRGVGVRMRQEPVQLSEEVQPSRETPPGPEGIKEVQLMGNKHGDDYAPTLNANLRVKQITGFTGKGEGTCWLRLPVPVVEGETNTPLTHLGMVSDYGSGFAQIIAPDTTGTINADICIYINRMPNGEWIALDCRQRLHTDGIGTVGVDLYDEFGVFGRSQHATMVQKVKMTGR